MTPRFDSAQRSAKDISDLLAHSYDMIQQMAGDLRAVLDEVKAPHLANRASIEETLRDAAHRGFIPHPAPDYTRLAWDLIHGRSSKVVAQRMEEEARKAEMAEALKAPSNSVRERYVTGHHTGPAEQVQTTPVNGGGGISDEDRTRVVNAMIDRLSGDMRLPYVNSAGKWDELHPLRGRFIEVLSAETSRAKQAVHHPALRNWFKARILQSVSPQERDTTFQRISANDVTEMVEWAFAQAMSELGVKNSR